ncbi:MAG: ABC transporter ATP-binding protein/permease [Firmicutes bacterium]|nr:ABC transporter ATP-binding protein/permease [Bacillota bacterium]
MGPKDAEPIKANQSTVRELLRYARPYGMLLLGVVALVIIYNLTQVIQPDLVKIAIDRYLLVKHARLYPLVMIGLIYLGITGAGLVANLIQTRWVARAGQQIVRQMRIDLFEHIESLSMQYFETHDTGRLLTNVSSDTTRISQFFTQFLLSVIRDGFTVILVLGAMLLLNWKLGLMAAIVIPIIAAMSLAFRPKLRTIYQATRSRLSRMIAFIAENLTGMRITQIFHQEAKQLQAFEALNQPYQEASIAEFRWDVLFNRSFDLLGNLAVAFVAWIGGRAVLHHSIQLGVLYAFISYIQQFFAPINSLTQNWNTLQSSMISAERVGGVLSTRPTLVDPDEPAVLPESVAGEIIFEDVQFAYKEDLPVLNGISLHVKPGAFVGIAGETGAGKSTLISLLGRFYDVTGGRILVDGIDIRNVRQQDLRRILAVVQQEVYLYSGTVLDNIRLFRPEVGREAVEAAARLTGADAFIRHLPQGYDTWLTPRGANLSTGQRQLLAFARTIILNPRILVLDEATANIDAISEMAVQKGLMEVAKNRTTLVIAHRLSTIRDAQPIVVLDRGEIREMGSHAELMARNGLYAEMVKKSRATQEQLA